MQSTDQLLARIDSLLFTQERKATDLHLRVMDLLDNPTQYARLLDWDIETLEVTHQDRAEQDWLDDFCSDVFASPFQAKCTNVHSPCVVCNANPSVPELDNLFCSSDCETSTASFTGPDRRSSCYFYDFYSQHDDLPKPLYASNVYVAPMYLLKGG